MQNKILVVVPTFNRVAITKRSVESLRAGTYTAFDLLISDSGSSDGTRESFSVKQNVIVLNCGAKTWWAGAVNRGIEYALGCDYYEYIVVLNDDVDIPITLIEQLLNAAKEYPDKIISPTQASVIGNFLGMTYSNLFKVSKVLYADGMIHPIEVHTTNGCCLLIPIKVFKKTGLFDEVNCPQLAADVEFQLRARAAGFVTIAHPKITIAQHVNTNYYRKLKLRNLLKFEGSPVHLSAYLSLGRTLFGGRSRFAAFGVVYHFRYFRSLAKAIWICFKGAERECLKKN